MTVISITTVEEFEKAIQDEQAFIKVSTTTCAPCKMMSPLFVKVAEEAQQGTFYSIEVDSASPELSTYAQQTLNISAVPVFFKYSSGNQVVRLAGAYPKSQLVPKLGIEI